MPSVSADTALALEILDTFLTCKESRQQSLEALVAVMVMIDPLRSDHIKLPDPGTPLKHSDQSSVPAVAFSAGLQSHLDRCITLSCSPEGVLSLLCAVFFDPSIPSNLVGAQMTGVMEALSVVKKDRRALLSVLSRKCPEIALLWPAAICAGKLEGILRSVEGGSPPLNMIVATWTGILQSFIQASYSSADVGPGQLLRASEFALTWFILPNANVPFVPSPPFGTVLEENLNLENRKHLGHHHGLMEYKMHWILELEGRSSGPDVQVNIPSLEVELAVAPCATSGKNYR